MFDFSHLHAFKFDSLSTCPQYVPVNWSNSFHSHSIRPAPSIKSKSLVSWCRQVLLAQVSPFAICLCFCTLKSHVIGCSIYWCWHHSCALLERWLAVTNPCTHTTAVEVRGHVQVYLIMQSSNMEGLKTCHCSYLNKARMIFYNQSTRAGQKKNRFFD